LTNIIIAVAIYMGYVSLHLQLLSVDKIELNGIAENWCALARAPVVMKLTTEKFDRSTAV